jgi:manganese/zinc/iron transport system substrate-binding protein
MQSFLHRSIHTMPTRLSTLILLCVGLILIASGCVTKTDAATSDGKIKAVATVGMVGDIVRTIGGSHVTVTQLMGSGVDPHLYKPTRDDVATILSGDIVFYSGLMLEGKMTTTLEKLSQRQQVVAVTDSIPRDRLQAATEEGEHYDPHVWMDVELWSFACDAVVEALCKHDPAHESDYRANHAAYKTQLNVLHQYGLAQLKTVPQSSRMLVTSHDAFNYLGKAYGIDVVGIQGFSTESEAGLQHINSLVDLLVSRNVKAVFVESSVSQKNILAVIDGAKSRGHAVSIGGELFSDAMGSNGTYEGTYIGMIDHNITTLVRALGGEAPQTGLNGKLSFEVNHE